MMSFILKKVRDGSQTLFVWPTQYFKSFELAHLTFKHSEILYKMWMCSSLFPVAWVVAVSFLESGSIHLCYLHDPVGTGVGKTGHTFYSSGLCLCVCVFISWIFVTQGIPPFYLYPQSFCGLLITPKCILFNLKVTQIHTKQVTGK